MTLAVDAAAPFAQDGAPATVWFEGSGERNAGAPPESSNCRRIRAADLRDAVRKTSRSRSGTAREHAVLIDIAVILNDVASEALRTYDEIDPRVREQLSTTLHYVGTPTGLAGLLSDIRALDIADGAVVIPIRPRTN
jgi:hypothetical protein